MAALRRARTGPDLEVASIIHEEVDRLPDHQRLAVVLCDLEGLTYEQAADRLRWTEPTLRHRLVKARRRLRERLTRRGVTAGSLGAGLAASAAGARAAVPAALARSAVAAATGGAASISAAALSARIIRGLLMTRLKIAAAASLMLVSLGVIAAGSWRTDAPLPVSAPAPLAQAGAEDETAPGRRRRRGAGLRAAAFVEVRGRVVDPQGRPVSGATVREAWLGPRMTRRSPTRPAAPDGRFVARISRSASESHALIDGRDAMPWIAATAPGFGPGWAACALRADASSEVTIRLAADGPPIEGRILDLEGRPVAGARVKVHRLWYARDERSWHVETGGLPAWLRCAGISASIKGPWTACRRCRWRSPPRRPTATAASAWRGSAASGSPNCSISGPTIATAQIYAICRDGPEVRCKVRTRQTSRRSSSTPRASSTPRRRANRSRA